jgi:hypothetical protein
MREDNTGCCMIKKNIVINLIYIYHEASIYHEG